MCWKLWFAGEGCFAQEPTAERDALWWSGALYWIVELLLEVLKENFFISFQFWMYEVPASALPEATWLTLDVQIGWGQDAVTAFLHYLHRCALCWDTSHPWHKRTSQHYGRDEFCPVIAAEKCSVALPSVKECAIRKHCVWQSPLMLCYRVLTPLDLRTYGAVFVPPLF